MKNFIEREALLRHGKEYTILDCRGSIGDNGFGYEEYKKGHIEGAQFVPADWMTQPAKAHGGRNPLPNMEEFAVHMQEVGVRDNKPVVIYDDWSELGMAGRLWWMLTYMGLEDVKILLGGMEAWKEEALPLTTEVVTPELGTLTMNLQKDLYVDYKAVQQIVATGDKTMVDARAPQRFTGEVEPLDPKPGHIPGAMNLFWKDLYEGHTIKSKEELESLVKPLKDTGKDGVMYCGSGISAPAALSVMGEAGIKPILYVGSMSDWQSHEDAPVEKSE